MQSMGLGIHGKKIYTFTKSPVSTKHKPVQPYISARNTSARLTSEVHVAPSPVETFIMENASKGMARTIAETGSPHVLVLPENSGASPSRATESTIQEPMYIDAMIPAHPITRCSGLRSNGWFE